MYNPEKQKDIHNGDALQIERVGQGGGHVAPQPERKGARQQGQERGRAQKQNGGQRNSTCNGKIACREGPQALARMSPIVVDIQQVVDQVVGRCRKTEAEKSGNRRTHRSGRKLMGEKKGHREEKVLGPLVRANCLEGGLHRGAPIHEAARHGDVPQAQPQSQPERWIRNHRLVRPCQHRQISPCIADIIEIVESRFQTGELPRHASGWFFHPCPAPPGRAQGVRPRAPPARHLLP